MPQVPTSTHTKTNCNNSTALILQYIYKNTIINACTLLGHVLESSVCVVDKKAKLQIIIIMFAEVDR